MEPKIVTVSPSAFGFLYEECPSCYYHEALGLRKRPRTPFLTIFTSIDLAMKEHFDSRLWHRLAEDGQRFRIISQGRWVKSQPIPIAGGENQLVIRGIYDSMIAFEHEARSICDFKTSPVNPALVAKYTRQLHSYAFALEHPAVGNPISIERLGLAVFEPQTFTANGAEAATLGGRFAWIDMPRDDGALGVFLEDVGRLLSGAPPSPSPACACCSYRDAA